MTAATKNSRGPVTVKLQYPITYTAHKMDGGDERTVSEVTLPARIKAKHLRAIDHETGEVGQALALIAKVTGLPREAIDELDTGDLEEIQKHLPLDQFQATGKTPSE